MMHFNAWSAWLNITRKGSSQRRVKALLSTGLISTSSNNTADRIILDCKCSVHLCSFLWSMYHRHKSTLKVDYTLYHCNTSSELHLWKMKYMTIFPSDIFVQLYVILFLFISTHTHIQTYIGKVCLFEDRHN